MNATTALRLGRVSNLPTVWSNVLAGAVLAGAVPGVVACGLLLLAFSLFYVGGMYLNDAFDAEHDAVMRPERPIPSGEVARKTVFTVGLGLLAAGVIVLALAAGHAGKSETPALVAGLVLALTILAYDAVHKKTQAALLLMAACRALVYLAAAAALTEHLSLSSLAGAGALAAYVVGLTAIAAEENRRSITRSWPLLLLAAPIAAALVISRPPAPMTIAWAGTLALWIVRGAGPLLASGTGNAERASVPLAVTRLIAGISLVDAALIAATGGSPAMALLAASGLPLTRLLQRTVPGT